MRVAGALLVEVSEDEIDSTERSDPRAQRYELCAEAGIVLGGIAERLDRSGDSSAIRPRPAIVFYLCLFLFVALFLVLSSKVTP